VVYVPKLDVVRIGSILYVVVVVVLISKSTCVSHLFLCVVTFFSFFLIGCCQHPSFDGEQ
jgi:hypothetical protein